METASVPETSQLSNSFPLHKEGQNGNGRSLAQPGRRFGHHGGPRCAGALRRFVAGLGSPTWLEMASDQGIYPSGGDHCLLQRCANDLRRFDFCPTHLGISATSTDTKAQVKGVIVLESRPMKWPEMVKMQVETDAERSK